jgi:polar amino acid transport system substrate-binding protein
MTSFISSDIVRAFTPSGALRASINVGNAILASGDAARGEARGVSVDLAAEFARRLGVPLELKVFGTAGESVEAISNEQADIGFFAFDPKRAAAVHFSEPYIDIEGSYMVRESSPLRENAEVDRAEHVVVVGNASAYDLFLSRELKHARLERAKSTPAVVEHFLASTADVAAGIKPVFVEAAAQRGGLRVLPGNFMMIRQTMVCPKSRGEAAGHALSAFVQEMKRSGFVADAMKRHGIKGAAVAP